MKIKKYIEIVTSPIGGLNLMPQKILLNLYEKLSKNYSKVKISIINNLDDLNNLVEKKPDLVVSGIKYLLFDKNSKKRDSIKKIWFPDFLEKHHILYTGSSKNALKLEFDKSIAKQRIRDSGLNTALSFLAKPNQYNKDTLPLPFPLFVKPLYEGDSRGIDENSLVHTYKEYKYKVKSIFDEQQTISLVETYLSGKEYTVAIIEDFKNSSYNIYPIELIAEKNSKGDRILGFYDKQRDREQSLKIKDKNIKKIISSLAIDAFKALKAKGYGRIDIKLNDKGIPYFIEANLVPGLGYGYFYRCYNLNTGQEHETMILDIVQSTFYKKLK
ncbi:MAG: D-alanine--D-alanine ligase [Sulfurimonas sp.]|nr:MAG: D-alanine--D-alanine ligase [Sulfurimonas sp.]